MGLLAWDDLNNYRAPTYAKPAVANPSAIQTEADRVLAPSGADGGEGATASSTPSGGGVSPATLSTIGTIGQVAGAVTGNQTLSQAGGMIGMAGSMGQATPAQAAGMVASGAAGLLGVPSAVIGAVAGGINNGVQGAVQGGINGALAMNPVTLAVNGITMLMTGQTIGSMIAGTGDAGPTSVPGDHDAGTGPVSVDMGTAAGNGGMNDVEMDAISNDDPSGSSPSDTSVDAATDVGDTDAASGGVGSDSDADE